MGEAAITLAALPLPSVLFVLVAGSARAMGALFGLWGLYFVLGPALLMRTGLALILSLPMLGTGAAQLAEMAAATSRVELLTVPVREFALGLGIGLLASLPFLAIVGAGLMIDQYRGDFSPSLPGPESQPVGSFANLTVVMALFVFVEAGGFAILMAALYQSYAIFPLDGPGLTLAPDAAARIAGLMQSVFRLLILVALPIMTVLFLVEVALNLTVRLGEKIRLSSAEFLVKNLIFLLAMPVLAMGLMRSIEAALTTAPPPIPTLEDLLGGTGQP